MYWQFVSVVFNSRVSTSIQEQHTTVHTLVPINRAISKQQLQLLVQETNRKWQ